MENHRDEAVLIAAGYPRACQRVLAANAGLQSRFPTVISFDSYALDKLIAIAEAIVGQGGDTAEPGTLHEVLDAPFTRYYNEQYRTEDQDVIRTIDTLGNGRFVRNLVKASQNIRDARVIKPRSVSASCAKMAGRPKCALTTWSGKSTMGASV
jgi:hypothetical protein